MKLDKNITRLGWIIVAVVLAISGIQHVITPEIYGRVRISGEPPLLEGISVIIIGLVELLIGIFLFLRLIRKEE